MQAYKFQSQSPDTIQLFNFVFPQMTQITKITSEFYDTFSKPEIPIGIVCNFKRSYRQYWYVYLHGMCCNTLMTHSSDRRAIDWILDSETPPHPPLRPSWEASQSTWSDPSNSHRCGLPRGSGCWRSSTSCIPTDRHWSTGNRFRMSSEPLWVQWLVGGERKNFTNNPMKWINGLERINLKLHLIWNHISIHIIDEVFFLLNLSIFFFFK